MNCSKPLLLLLVPLLCIYFSAAQNSATNSLQEQFQIHIKKTHGVIKLDGILDEADWKDAEPSSPFWRKFPSDNVRPKRQTEVRITYNDQYIYFGFVVHDSSNQVVQSLKRDGGHELNDAVGIILDPINQRTNGFFFVVNAFNTQTDDQLNGTSNQLTLSWDNKWYSETKRYDDKWVAEIAIPFKTIRYTSDKTLWGINFLRSDLKTNEYSTWTKMPLNFRAFDLGYTGSLIWDAPPPSAGSNVSFIPYVTGGVNGNKEENEPTKATGNAGFDAKVALSSALNLDLTVNPDFSQIEVDKQVTNLTRFSIFFPERRTFFLENADLFSEYGIPPIRPFYSRRIGLDNDGNKIPILFGARLSGNVAKRTRIGIMSMETGRKDGFAGQNYSAISISQSVLKRSVVRGYFLNQQSFLNSDEKAADPLKQYGRNAGADFNYSNLDGTWAAWAAYHQSFKPGIKSDNLYLDAGINYSTRKFGFVMDVSQVGTNYYTDMGYVERILNYDAARDTSIRVGFKHVFTEINYRIIPPNGAGIRHTFNFTNYYVVYPNNSFNEMTQELNYNMEFRNTSSINVLATRDDVQLLYPISFTDKVPLPADRYKFQYASVDYFTDTRKVFSFTGGLGGGSFYNGRFRQLKGGITFRRQPYFAFAIEAQYNKLSFPDPYGATELFLIAPRIEINFSTKLFWTTFLQYNTQANNFNINSRFQWRYKPMSDLFVVYTDNYFTDPLFKNKNRALVFKLNYWLNL